MEDKKNHPDIPSNYVTLLQLQERWIKQQQQRKQKEKEDEEERQKQQQQQHSEEREQKLEGQRLREGQAIRRNSNRPYRRKNRNLTVSSGVNSEETGVLAMAVVEANGNESTAKKEIKIKRWPNKKKKKEREFRSHEEELTVRDAHAPPAKSEPARKSEKKKEMWTEFSPKSNNVVEENDRMLEIEPNIKKVVEESDQTVEIEQKFGDLSIAKDNVRSEKENRVINRRNREYRGHNTGSNRSNTGHNTGYNGGVNRGNREYRGYGTGSNRSNGRYTGGYGRFDRSGEPKGRYSGMVWVRKEEVADGGDVAGNQSLLKVSE